MTNEISLQDVANYLDNIGIQFLATIGLDGKPKVRPMQYMILDDGKLWFCLHSKRYNSSIIHKTIVYGRLKECT